MVALADFLVGLKDSPGVLINQRAAHIIALWKNLTKYDRKPIVFPFRHQTKLVQSTQCRFKATKKRSPPLFPGSIALNGVSEDRTVDQLPGLTATGTWRL